MTPYPDWRIRACGAGGCSAWSATLGVYVLPTSPPPCLNPPCIQPKIAGAPKVSDGSGSPSGELVVDTAYSATTGYPETLTRDNDGSVYAHIGAMDAWGHATLVYEGGSDSGSAAVTLIRGYNQATGLATSTAATNAANVAVASLTTTWDGFGNLASRSEQTSAMTGTSTENTITYDALNRLTGSTTTLSGGGSLTRSYSYDPSGNRTQACANSVCTTYSYGTNGAGPHAVSAVNGNTGGYAYDADGEMTTDADRTLYWSAFGKATSIAKGNTTVTIDYGPGDSRYRKEVIGPNPETVTYLGGAELLSVNGGTSIRRTLSLADVSIIDTGGTQSQRLYPVTDNLGSTVAIAGSTGSLTQGLAYADFGQRYTAGWAGPLGTAQATTINQTETDKGYTGQESLDSIGLDDYNARLYDPGLGRFLSVDPKIAHPGSTQSINPYSYVENNPLNKTDPTGEMDQCMANGHCSGVTIEGVGSIGSEGHQQQQNQNNSDQQQSDKGSKQDQGTTAQNSTNGDSSKVNDHDIKNKKKDSADGNGRSSTAGDHAHQIAVDRAKFDKAVAKYHALIKKEGNTEALKQFARTKIVFDPKFTPSSNTPEAGAEGCNDCRYVNHGAGIKPADQNEIIVGPKIVEAMSNPNNPAEFYHGAYWTPGPEGVLEIVAHEFGHTMPENARLANEYPGPTAKETNAQEFMVKTLNLPPLGIISGP